MKITFTIPLETPTLNRWYSGGHWSKRKELADEWHEAVWLVCREQGIKPVTEFPISITTKSYRKRSLDVSNAITASKLVEDGLVKAKILPDDTPQYVARHVVEAVGKATKGCYVVVTIETMKGKV